MGNTATKLEIYESPLEAELGDILNGDLTCLFATFIVNPFGPTLQVLGTVGKYELGSRLQILKILLNPFTQIVEQVGVFWVGDSWEPARDIAPFLNLNFGDCPTAVLVCNGIEEPQAKELSIEVFKSFGQPVARVARQVSRYFGDPWSRVSAGPLLEDPSISAMAIERAAIDLTEASASASHLKAELQAFLYAWNGSIEQTGISNALKDSAMPVKQLKALLFEHVLPSLRVPEFEINVESPGIKKPSRLRINTPEDVDAIMQSAEWQQFEENKLFDLLLILFTDYGHNENNTRSIDRICDVYQYAQQRVLDSDARLRLQEQLTFAVDANKLPPFVLIPFLVLEKEGHIVGKATFDFISTSPLYKGEPFAFTEIRQMLEKRTLENPGAVFGALIAMGDQRIIDFAKTLLNWLTIEDLAIAVTIHSQHLQHSAIQFWLDWAEETVGSSAEMGAKIFGISAKALTNCLKYQSSNRVRWTHRNIPARNHDCAIAIEQEWSIEDYAELLAPKLYEIEAREQAPKLFSDVLRRWGIQPAAPLIEQFIPDAQSNESPFKRLTDFRN